MIFTEQKLWDNRKILLNKQTSDVFQLSFSVSPRRAPQLSVTVDKCAITFYWFCIGRRTDRSISYFIFRLIRCNTYHHIFRKEQEVGWMAEWSKALVSGTSLRARVRIPLQSRSFCKMKSEIFVLVHPHSHLLPIALKFEGDLCWIEQRDHLLVIMSFITSLSLSLSLPPSPLLSSPLSSTL